LPPEIAAKLEKRKRFPRARRWIFNFAAALSLVLFVGNYACWVRGILGHHDELRLPRVHKYFFFVSSLNGQVKASCVALEEAQGADWEDMKEEIDNEWSAGFHTTEAYVGAPKVFQWFKRGHDCATPFSPKSMLNWVSIPCWFLQLLFAILPLWWLGRFALRWSEKKRSRDSSLRSE
jgi:hypothetical protein